MVNGPGEAVKSDIGVVGAANGAEIFLRGKKMRTVPYDQAVRSVLDEVRSLGAR
jgi:4-hydroxy-3-methylbut-2-en-1-yl diphosphate synthase IspG/GcpE